MRGREITAIQSLHLLLLLNGYAAAPSAVQTRLV